MKRLVLVFSKEKETKGTYRYQEVEDAGATSSQVVYDDDLVIHRHQLAAASSGVTSFSSMTAWAVFSDSALR